MPKTHKQKLERDALKASRIQQTISTNGWNDIREIIDTKFSSLMDELREKENPEARGGLNAIVEIMNDISRDLEFGKVAHDKYKKQFMSGVI